MISAEGGSSTQQRKRQRLDQLVDRIAHFVSSSQASVRDKHVSETCLSATATMSRFHFRCPSRQNQVFNFDHVVLPSDRSDEEAEEDVFSPLATFSDRLTLSPCGSSADSPGISFSPLSLDDDRHHSGPLNLSKSSAHVISPPFITSSPIYTRGVRLGSSVLSDFRRRARSDSDLHETLSLEYPSTVTPWIVTPAPFPQTPIQFPRSSRLEHLRPPPLTVSVKRSSTDSDSSSPLLQESPVDLSVRSGSSASSDSTNQSTLSGEYPGRTPVISRSLGTRPKFLTRSLSLTQHLTSSDFSNDSIGDDSTMGPPKPPFTCEVCGQVFDLHDRLVKHLASRHRSKQRALPEGAVAKGYQCDVCQRSFARSDMLTRHMRLHTGLKPYTCRICGQVFSRSDHLSTHQRTHTGEKPYRCPKCAYAACRRDMITRHLRTHMRSEDLDDSSRRKDCV